MEGKLYSMNFNDIPSVNLEEYLKFLADLFSKSEKLRNHPCSGKSCQVCLKLVFFGKIFASRNIDLNQITEEDINNFFVSDEEIKVLQCQQQN